MSSRVVALRKVRGGRISVTVRVCPEKPGHQANAPIVGRVREGKLVSANGIKWSL